MISQTEDLALTAVRKHWIDYFEARGAYNVLDQIIYVVNNPGLDDTIVQDVISILHKELPDEHRATASC